MALDYHSLPVYAQKQRILDTLAKNQVIVVQSPTGSGKTTQIPVILHEAGYSQSGMIAVTQPRRIAALSVSEFIAKQLKTTYPGLVGYKMRFEDKTDETTRIKIMTDGILLQELKLDPWLHKYSVIMVDEAHERSLNIDFVLGLLKRIIAERSDFKVIISSATMNAEAFSVYFDGCPIVTIDTDTYPVAMVYDPPAVPVSTISSTASEALLAKIEETIDRVLDNKEKGDILIFLPGEKIIKDCAQRLSDASFARSLHIVPLYGRLPKEDQEKVFDPAPFGKKKVVISTNIAETSITIDGITTVIDPGLAKLNFYSPRTFTSSLVELPVSKASCNQRKGRAGRTQPGTCYRLYSRNDYETRQLYTTEEIYRTDLSEVVLRMSELGITDFEKFDFISPPSREGLLGGVETLRMLKALDPDNSLSAIGKLMVNFPLEPRISRIIAESIMRYPDILEEVIIVASFLSAKSPFVLPPGEETDARKAHHNFRDMQGDFVAYVKLFRTYESMKNKVRFCKNSYLDERVMAEIENITIQLTEIIGNLEIPVSGGGSFDDLLCCIAAGMIQFVCVRVGRENYRSLTAEHISIHPGSGMFRTDPLYIVAGEIVRTSRMFAMSVSPLTRPILSRIDPELEQKLENVRHSRKRDTENTVRSPRRTERRTKTAAETNQSGKENGESVLIGGTLFPMQKIKGRKTLLLGWEKFRFAVAAERNEDRLVQLKKLRGRIIMKDDFTLLSGEKMDLILKAAKSLNLEPLAENSWNRKMNVQVGIDNGTNKLLNALDFVLRVTVAKTKSKEYGFITLFTDGNGTYWFKVSRGFSTAVNESLSSLESLIDDTAVILSGEQKTKLNTLYRILNSMYD
ncbi:MAG: ATP-dependent RNA helicase [Treponema sp.]|jgi:RNA helicase HrpA|nr:ATP-dependent RNA helicase [Treponema sp.]